MITLNRSIIKPCSFLQESQRQVKATEGVVQRCIQNQALGRMGQVSVQRCSENTFDCLHILATGSDLVPPALPLSNHMALDKPWEDYTLGFGLLSFRIGNLGLLCDSVFLFESPNQTVCEMPAMTSFVGSDPFFRSVNF